MSPQLVACTDTDKSDCGGMVNGDTRVQRTNDCLLFCLLLLVPVWLKNLWRDCKEWKHCFLWYNRRSLLEDCIAVGYNIVLSLMFIFSATFCGQLFERWLLLIFSYTMVLFALLSVIFQKFFGVLSLLFLTYKGSFMQSDTSKRIVVEKFFYD